MAFKLKSSRGWNRDGLLDVPVDHLLPPLGSADFCGRGNGELEVILARGHSFSCTTIHYKDRNPYPWRP